jgi:hypothetical protein
MIEALNNELNSIWQLLKKKNKPAEPIQVGRGNAGDREMHNEHENEDGEAGQQ